MAKVRYRASKIQKGVPIPPKREHSTLYPFKKMKRGDSFTVDVPEGESYTRVQMAGMRAAYNQGFKGRVTSRTSEDKKLVRFWLVE